MKFAVFGAGGVGGYFGARLAASGNEVAFIARGRHLEAMRANGLRVTSAYGDVTIKPARATDDPATVGPVDCVLLCVKLWDLDEAAAASEPLVAGGGYVVPIQNGVDSTERAAARLGAARVVGGIAYIAAVIEAPGVIKHTGTMARLAFGEADGSRSARVEQLLAACRAARIDAEVPDSIATAQWRKFVFLASVSGWTALARQPMGVLAKEPELRAGLRNAIAEVVAVGRARGVDLPADSVDATLAMVDRLPAEMRTSMQQDLERGNRLELPWLSGAVARLGRAAGVPTPTHDVIAAALKPYADGAAR
ncbi:MAG: 2-dehydropantoate 2-reductase [Alphaproteobacteria bacterium]|nr:2-dehydropantoate 2-reductase [Alphaproteobacteria bacterium]